MTLQTTGAISMGDLRTEFGLTGQTSMDDYYNIVDDVPASGALALDEFYGRQRKGKLHAIGFWKSSLQTGKTTGVSSMTNNASGDYNWNYTTALSASNNPCLHMGTDNRQSGFGGGDDKLFFYKYGYTQATTYTRCRHRYNANRAGRDWAINHMSMLSWAHYD